MLQDYPAARVLVGLRYGIGDVVMEMPVLRALRRALPAAHVTALGMAPATELLEGEPVVDEVASLTRWGFRHRWHRGAEGARDELQRWLDRGRFDLLLDVHHLPPLVGEVVWGRGIRTLEADEGVEAAAVADGADGVSAIRAAVQVGWGMEVQESPPRLAPTAEERRFAHDFLRGHGVARRPVAISPVASLRLKRWPPERLAALADRLLEGSDDRLLLFAGPQHRSPAELLRAMRHADRVVTVGPLHLRRVAALLQACRALVCNDTGLMHVAAALEVPTVAVFGPTLPQVYRPPATCARSVGGQEVRCPHRSTGSLHPPACWAEDRCLIAEQGCIHQVETDQVWEALQLALHGARAPLAPPTAR